MTLVDAQAILPAVLAPVGLTLAPVHAVTRRACEAEQVERGKGLRRLHAVMFDDAARASAALLQLLAARLAVAPRTLIFTGSSAATAAAAALLTARGVPNAAVAEGATQLLTSASPPGVTLVSFASLAGLYGRRHEPLVSGAQPFDVVVLGDCLSGAEAFGPNECRFFSDVVLYAVGAAWYADVLHSADFFGLPLCNLLAALAPPVFAGTENSEFSLPDDLDDARDYLPSGDEAGGQRRSAARLAELLRIMAHLDMRPAEPL